MITSQCAGNLFMSDVIWRDMMSKRAQGIISNNSISSKIPAQSSGLQAGWLLPPAFKWLHLALGYKIANN